MARPNKPKGGGGVFRYIAGCRFFTHCKKEEKKDMKRKKKKEGGGE
jgi:hypothetical protein